MSRRVIVIAVVGFLICAAFVAGAITAIMRGWGSPLVSISVQNNTSAEIRFVNLNYSSCGAKNTFTIQTLPPGKAHVFRFLVCGEGGYQVEAVLQDGRTLKSPEGYVESGYSSSELVEPMGIRSEVRTYRL
jgi:hypothetical protein